MIKFCKDGLHEENALKKITSRLRSKTQGLAENFVLRRYSELDSECKRGVSPIVSVRDRILEITEAQERKHCM